MTAITGVCGYPICWHRFRSFQIETIGAAGLSAATRALAHRFSEKQPESCEKDHSIRPFSSIRYREELIAGIMAAGFREQGCTLFAALDLEVVVAVVDGHDSTAKKRAVRLGASMYRHRIPVDVCVLPHHVSGS